MVHAGSRFYFGEARRLAAGGYDHADRDAWIVNALLIRILFNPCASTKRTPYFRLARPLAAGTGRKRPG